MSSSRARPRKTSSPAATWTSRAQFSDNFRIVSGDIARHSAERSRAARTGDAPRARVAGGVRDEAVSVGVDCPARRGVVECSESVAARGVVVQVAILAPLAPASDRLAQATWVVREVEDLEGGALEGFHLLVVEDLDVADALAGEEEPAEGGGGGVAQPHPAAYITRSAPDATNPASTPYAPTRSAVTGPCPSEREAKARRPRTSLLADTARGDGPRQGRPRADSTPARATTRARSIPDARETVCEGRGSHVSARSRARDGRLRRKSESTTTSGSRRRSSARARASVFPRGSWTTRRRGHSSPRGWLCARPSLGPSSAPPSTASPASPRARRDHRTDSSSPDVSTPDARARRPCSPRAVDDAEARRPPRTTPWPRSPGARASTCSSRSPAPPSARVRGASSLPLARARPLRPSPRTVVGPSI